MRGRSSRNVSSSRESRSSTHHPIQGSGTPLPARATVAGKAGDARPVARAAPFAPADASAPGRTALGDDVALERQIISRFLALFVLVGTTFAQTETVPTAATVEVWPEGKMPGNGAKEPEAEGAAEGWLSPHHQCQPPHVDAVSRAAESGRGGGTGHDRLSRRGLQLRGHRQGGHRAERRGRKEDRRHSLDSRADGRRDIRVGSRVKRPFRRCISPGPRSDCCSPTRCHTSSRA